jgi:predicted DNA-binding transcriptional regulator AlpA
MVTLRPQTESAGAGQMLRQSGTYEPIVGSLAPLLSPRSLAEYCRVPEDTVQKWMRQGRLPPPDVRLGKRLVRWRWETIKERIDSGQLLD